MNTNPQNAQELPIGKRGLLSKFFKLFSVKDKTESTVVLYSNESQDLIESINNAKNEWICANTNFEYADDEETVDYYTYKIKACEIKYEYLIRKAKEKGIRVDLAENTVELTNGNEMPT